MTAPAADLLAQFQPLPSVRIQTDTAPVAGAASDGVPIITGPAAYSDLPREAYDAMVGWNASLLKVVLEKTLGHAWWEFRRSDREPQPDNEAFIRGNQLHTLLLEPERYAERYALPPADMPKRPTEKQLQEPTAKPGTKAHTAWLAAREAEAAWDRWEKGVPSGARLITAAQHEEVSAWAAAVQRHPRLGPLFAPEHRGLNELTLTWLDPITKAPCKARLDALRIFPDRIWIGDLKTAAAGGDPFARSAGNFGYPISATFYADAVFFCRAQIERLVGLADGALIGLPVEFEWVVIEKSPPHFIQRLTLGAEHVELSRKLIRRALDAVVAAEERNWWPAYSEEARPLELPGYWYAAMERLIVAMEDGAR